MKGLPTLAVDFDGVVHRYSRGWEDGTIYDDPMPGAFEALRELRTRFEVVIYTTRAAKLEPMGPSYGSAVRAVGVIEIQKWFRTHGGEDLANMRITEIKPPAVAYIDDRAIRFLNWRQALDAVEIFVE